MYQDQYDKDTDAYIVAIETTTPFNVQIYKLDDSLLFKGWMDYDYYTDKFKEWDGKPQGYCYSSKCYEKNSRSKNRNLEEEIL